MDLLIVIGVIIALGFLVYGIYQLVMFIMRKRSATMVESSEIQKDIRRVQVVDVREPDEFNAKHILGARNIPLSQFDVRLNELRRDTPIYLYDDNVNMASRGANKLRKAGYENIHILKGGFSKWLGKTKSEL